MITEKMIEAALDAALKADIIPIDGQDGVRINDYLQYMPEDAVELGVQLTEKTSDGKPRWHGYSDIMGDEHDDTDRAILRPLIEAALEAALSTDAEPVAWYWIDLNGIKHVSEYYPPVMHGTFLKEQTPLYEAPPQTAPSVAVKALEWEDAQTRTHIGRYFQANTTVGQYQVSYLGELECWQLYSPQKSSRWEENFSRHKSSDEAKEAAQAEYEARIRSALA